MGQTHFETFEIDGQKAGAIVREVKEGNDGIYTGRFRLAMKPASELIAYSNTIIYHITANGIFWLTSSFSEEGHSRTLSAKNGEYTDESGETWTKTTPDFAYFVLLDWFFKSGNTEIDFHYINSRTGEIIPECRFKYSESDRNTSESHRIDEYKNGKRANTFWLSDEGLILRSDWQGAVSFHTDKDEVLSGLPEDCVSFLNGNLP